MTSVNVGFDLVPALLSKQVDAAIGTYFNIEGIHIESETGEAPVIVKMEELGVPTYDELIVVGNSERLQSDAGVRGRRQPVPHRDDRGDEGRAGRRGRLDRDDGGEHRVHRRGDRGDGSRHAAAPLLDRRVSRPGASASRPGQTFGDWMVDNGLLEAAVDPATIATNDYLPAC